MDDVAILLCGNKSRSYRSSNRKKSQEIHDCCFHYGKDIKVPYGSILPSVSVGRSVFAQQLTDTEHLLG